MSEVVCLQRPVGTEWIYEKTQPLPLCPPEHCSPGPPGPSDPADPLGAPDPPGPQTPPNTAGKGPRGGGEAAIVLKEVRRQRRLWESPQEVGLALKLGCSELGGDM